MAAGSASAEIPDREVFITRLLDAPRELVFAAWTDPAQLAEWFAPNGCSVTIAELDVRAGGRLRWGIVTPDGSECLCAGSYREVTVPERLVFSMALVDEMGNRISSAEAGKEPDWPSETVVTVTFEEEAGKTRLTLRQNVLESIAKRTGAHPGWLQMLDRLAARLGA